MDLGRPPRLVVAAILLMACSVAAFDYGMGRVGQPNVELLGERLAAHWSILELHPGAQSPYRYRLLAPLLIQALALPVAWFAGFERAFHVVSALFYAGALWLMLLVLDRYLERWFSPAEALVGTLATASTLPITLRQHIYAPWSWLEPTLLMVGLLCILDRRGLRLLVLSVVATLNRETGILVAIAFLVDALSDKPRSMRRLLAATACIALSAATIGAVRIIRGPGPPAIALANVWAFNRSDEGLLKAAVNGALFMGVAGWALVALGFAQAPAFVKRMAWLVVVYLPMYLIGGIWYEVRLLMPLYPVLVPSLLSAIYRPRPVPAHPDPQLRQPLRR